MTYFQAYLFTRLDSLGVLFATIIAASVIISILMSMSILYCDTDNDIKNCEIDIKNREIKNRIKNTLKITLPIILIFSIAISLLPNSKEAAFIYIAPKIVNNKDLQETLTKMPKLTNLGLDYLNNILEEKIKK